VVLRHPAGIDGLQCHQVRMVDGWKHNATRVQRPFCSFLCNNGKSEMHTVFMVLGTQILIGSNHKHFRRRGVLGPATSAAHSKCRAQQAPRAASAAS
jgi:hypothetical protein